MLQKSHMNGAIGKLLISEKQVVHLLQAPLCIYDIEELL